MLDALTTIQVRERDMWIPQKWWPPLGRLAREPLG